MSEVSTSRAERAANLFDLRRIIGGVFVVWGVLLTILGLTGSEAETTKAAGMNINLLAGLIMLVFGLCMLAWALLRPLGAELREAESEESAGSPQRAAPRGDDAAALSSEQARRSARGDREGTGRTRDPGSQ